VSIRSHLSVPMIGALVILLISTASAQTTYGRIEGRITDATGGVLQGAAVTVIQPATRFVRTVVTNELGLYRVQNLSPGEYDVAAELGGFVKATRSWVRIDVGQTIALNIGMEVGNVATVLNVAPPTPIVNAATPEISRTIDTRQVSELPLNGRDFTRLSMFAPGVVQTSGLIASIAVNATSVSQNNFLLDGIDATRIDDSYPSNGFERGSPLQTAKGRSEMTTACPVSSQPGSSANPSHRKQSDTSIGDDGLSAFLRMRPRLFGIAYRMLGSAAEAEDVVQDVWLRWQTTDRSMVRDAAAFLVTTATRLAINVVQSARSRRETRDAPWLPEPVDTSADSGLGAELHEALELGVLLLLERLSPAERAAYILREAFDYAYRDIANILRFEEANARQVVTRARQHVTNGRRMPASSTEQRRLLDSFIAAARHGDVDGLEGLLASDVVSTSARAAAA
jgi:RNA polymerase sigma factor (sigma-70 family)